MTDPYRDADAVHCLACQRPLRADGESLRCDDCGAALVPTSALLATIRDLTSLPTALAFDHERPHPSPCPRCAGPMTRCRIDARLEEIHAHPWRSLLRCPTDGIWFGPKRLERFLELVAKKARQQYKNDLPIARMPGPYS